MVASARILLYIAQGFEGLPLVPRDPVGAAVTEQWIAGQAGVLPCMPGWGEVE
jgi:glutathione S-transferase